MNILLGMAPNNPSNLYLYREPKMEWLAMIFMTHGPHKYPMFLDVIDQNALDDELFKFFCKENLFARKVTLL